MQEPATRTTRLWGAKKSRGLGLGSLWFTKHRSRVLPPAEVQDDVTAGQRIVLAHEGRQSQRIAFALASIKAFPMTHHVECVALLAKN